MGPFRFRRTSQPQQAVGVNWGNPLARGLVGVLAPEGDVGVGRFSGVNAPTVSPTNAGIGIKTTNAAANYVTGPRNVSPKTLQGSVLAVFVADSLANEIALFCTANSTNYVGFVLTVGTSGIVSAMLGDGGGVWPANRRSFHSPVSTVSVGKLFAVTFAADSLTVGRMFANGVKQTLSTSGTAASYSPGTAAQTAIIGARLSGSPQMFGDKTVLLAASWDRALADAELLSLSLNPWQLFQPQDRSIWVPTSVVSTLPTLSAATFVSATSTSLTPQVTATWS